MTKREVKLSGPELKALLLSDADGFRRVLQSVVQEVLEAEITEALEAGKGERTAERVGYRSGYYERRLVTRVGVLELRVPQDRTGRFSTELFERYQRSEKALVSALVEMYVQGVSTRKVKAIPEELCGHAFSAATVSAATVRLDEALKAFFEQPLKESYPYLILDARASSRGRRDRQPGGWVGLAAPAASKPGARQSRLSVPRRSCGEDVETVNGERRIVRQTSHRLRITISLRPRGPSNIGRRLQTNCRTSHTPEER